MILTMQRLRLSFDTIFSLNDHPLPCIAGPTYPDIAYVGDLADMENIGDLLSTWAFPTSTGP